MDDLEALRKQILELVEVYATNSLKDSKFTPGQDPISVSGKVLSPNDFSSIVDSTLDGWFTSGRFTTKFEKDLDAVSSASVANSSYLTYEFIQAYPSDLFASPVSYQGSQVLKYTVVFDYMRYITRRTPAGFITDRTSPNSGQASGLLAGIL